jgi:anti-anti-sigma factor
VEKLGPEPARVEFDVVTGSSREVIVTIHGELDITAVDDLRDQVEPLLERGSARLIVDVSHVRFADSSAIALWVRWSTSVPAIELRDVSPILRRVIDSMGLAGTLNVKP